MRLEDFQRLRNCKAEHLRSIPDIEERREAALQLAERFEKISAHYGFITQTHWWIFEIAGLHEQKQLELIL